MPSKMEAEPQAPGAKKWGLLSSKVRRGQLMVGLGVFAYVLGSILSSSILLWVDRWKGQVPAGLGTALFLFSHKLWALVVLPIFCGLVARWVPLSPWKTSISAVASGQALSLVVWGLIFGASLGAWIPSGAGGWLVLALEVAMLGAGGWLTAQAVRLGRTSGARPSPPRP